jgi:hypothetical protein
MEREHVPQEDRLLNSRQNPPGNRGRTFGHEFALRWPFRWDTPPGSVRGDMDVIGER